MPYARPPNVVKRPAARSARFTACHADFTIAAHSISRSACGFDIVVAVRHRPAIVLAIVLLAVLFGTIVRSRLGIELSSESIQQAVLAMGWKAPALFVGLLTFRQFLFIPAIVLLSAGGLCFGAALGSVLGAAGIVFSALLSFGLARGLAGGWLHLWLAARHAWIARGIGRVGPVVVGAVTAHPTGPMSALFWGAGFSSMAFVPFLIAVVIGGSLRAVAFSVLGATLHGAGTTGFYAAAALLAALAIAPLLHPGLRRRMRSLLAADGSPLDPTPGDR